MLDGPVAILLGCVSRWLPGMVTPSRSPGVLGATLLVLSGGQRGPRLLELERKKGRGTCSPRPFLLGLDLDESEVSVDKRVI